MRKKITRPIVLLLFIVILSSLLTICASGSFFYRHAVLSCEAQKTLLLNLNLSYTYLLNSIQENSKKYILTDDLDARDKFSVLTETYTKSDSIHMNFDPLSQLQSSAWLSNDFYQDKSNMSALAKQLDFKGEELSSYLAYRYSFDQIVAYLSLSVANKDENVFTNAFYSENWRQCNYYMVQFTSSYINRINIEEDAALKSQNLFGFLSLFFSLILAAVAAFVAYSTVLTNRTNSYYHTLFSSTVEHADFGLAIIDRYQKIRYMNHQYREVLGLTDSHPVGKTTSEILPDELRCIILEEAKVEDSLFNATFPLTVNGGEKHINVSRFAVRDKYDQINFVSIIRDVTDLVTMETQLKEQLSEIEFHAKAKDTFMANISHEIKTPLNAIIGLSYMLSDTNLSNNQQGIIGRITSASNLLLNLINDVLDLSKIKNSDFKLYPTDFLLTNLLSEIEGIATALIGEKNVLWKTEYHYNPALCLHMDKTKVTQVILNLVNNACKFTSEGTIKLLVETIEEDADNAVLKFSIVDTGLGIEASDLEKIFQEFEQLENHLTKQHRGTGLGLIICKNIIETMGGKIWVTSKKDVGSDFSFTLPVTKSSPETLRASLDLESVPVLNGEGKRILVVEDNEINYEVTASILAKSNILCENAADGEIALSMCKNAADDYYQLILMDIHMPNMDGYTASKILKQELNIITPILALTATKVESQTLSEYEGIIDGYIPKPFTYFDLLSKIAPYFNPSRKFSLERRKNLTARMEDPFSGRALAIENLGGMEDLYEKHLKKFKINYSNLPDQLEKLLEEDNRKEMLRLVHSVKGLAGTLGLPYLQKISGTLEDALLANQQDIRSLLDAFAKKLTEVCQH